ncbi:MAG: zinc-ribbon domain-containing protein [Acidobacteriota bacterium]
MAIIRCPYCHAIIDENDKYCNNCGTQLLFPEDESVEEEIPGEKIIEAEPDDEEKDYEIEEPDKGTAELSAKEEETKDVTEKSGTGPWGGTEPAEIGELLEEEAAEDEEDEEEAEEVILVDEIAAEEAAAAIGKDTGEDEAPPEEPAGEPAAEAPRVQVPAPEEETRAYEVSPAEDEEAADEIVEPTAAVPPSPRASAAESREEQGAGPAEDSPEEETPEAVEVETEEEVRTGEIPDEESEEPSSPPPAARPVTFDTRELEGIGPTVELGKERLDKLMEVMAEKQKERETPAEQAPKAEPVKRTGTLPPWADKIRSSASGVEGGAAEEAGEGAPGAGAEFGEGEEGLAGSAETAEDTAEEEIFPHRKASDSGIGLPERLTQAALPFEAPAAEEGMGEEAEEE